MRKQGETGHVLDYSDQNDDFHPTYLKKYTFLPHVLTSAMTTVSVELFAGKHEPENKFDRIGLPGNSTDPSPVLTPASQPKSNPVLTSIQTGSFDVITKMPEMYHQYSNINDESNRDKRTLRITMIFLAILGPLCLIASTAYAFTINPFDRTDFNQVSISETIDGNRPQIIACRIIFAFGGTLIGILATFRQIQIGMNYKHFHSINTTTDTVEYKNWQRCNKCGMFVAFIAVFSFNVTAIVTTSMHTNIHLLSALSAILFTGIYHYFHGCLIKHERELQEKKTFVTRKLEFYLLMGIVTWCLVTGLYFGYLLGYELYVKEKEAVEIRGFLVWEWQLLWLGCLMFLFYGEIFYRDPFNDQLTVFYDEHLKDNEYIPNCCLKYCLCYCCECEWCRIYCQCCCVDVTRPTSMRSVHINAARSIQLEMGSAEEQKVH